MSMNVKMCIQQCDPKRLLRLYLQCFGAESEPVPTPAEKTAFRKLLDRIGTVIPEETEIYKDDCTVLY